MTYAVRVKSGYSKYTVRFAKPGEALARALDEIDHDAEDVVIVVSATQEKYSVEAFVEYMRNGQWKTDNPAAP